MSGWKITSILGTILNRALILASANMSKVNIRTLYVHGDDLDLELDSYSDAFLLAETINLNGFDISIDKNMINNRYYPVTEFLKTMIFKRSICAYSSRMASSMIYNKPWTHTDKMEYNHGTG